jgi:PPM family protein phosphatase
MAELHLQVGAHSVQGLRANNEDRFVADPKHNIFLVADGMGGQEAGERASGLAAEIIPRALQKSLAEQEDGTLAVQKALDEANQAIIKAGQGQSAHRRMGTTAVLAIQQRDRVYVAGVGDSRAYFIRANQVRQLTLDHTVADALERNGTLTAKQASESPWRHHLYRFLGCAQMTEGADVVPFTPQAGDMLLLGTDGLTNHLTNEDLLALPNECSNPQKMAERLVELALERGSKDNVTCVVVCFQGE